MKETIDGYQCENGRIISPGKFEGQPVFAPYFWGKALEGFSDDDDGSIYTFKITVKDGAVLHEDDCKFKAELKKWLGRKRTLRMREDSQGFVSCF